MKQTIKSLLLSFAAMLFVISASAQVTTASLNGKVADKDGMPIPGATAVAVHTPSGTQYYAVANAEGRFYINGMRAGGPYTVEVSCLGYQTVNYTDVTLQLAEAYNLNAQLADDAQMLTEAIVVSTAASRFATEKTGAATNINNSQISALPSVTRSITDVTRLSPYGGNGMSFAGSDGRTANFTVDGADFNNNFGLSDALPGGGNPISIDAIEELQVVISPYDVRQTNFIGGGVNAITKSGTNTFKGTAYVYHRNENLRGDTVGGEQISGARAIDRNTNYGFTLGGPIIKNKLFFFVNAEYSQTPSVAVRWRASENGVGNSDKYLAYTSVEDMERVKDHVMTKYGYDTGSYTDFPADESNVKLLARLDWNINDAHKLALRYNYTNNTGWNGPNASSMDGGTRSAYARTSLYSMAFANSMYSMNNLVHSVSLDLNSRLGDNLSNQFLATFSKLDDVRGTNSSEFPFIDIQDGTNTNTQYMALGYELFTWNNAVHNTHISIKDDLVYYAGNHKVTMGVNYEYQMADNAYMRNGTGYYRYASVDDFINGAAPEVVCLTYGYDGEKNPAARVQFHKAGIYAQDEWNATENFKLTAGIRFEMPFYPTIEGNNNKEFAKLAEGQNSIHGLSTADMPKARLNISPRVGFNWDVLKNRNLIVRGGTGIYTGRIPFVWIVSAAGNSNCLQAQYIDATGTGDMTPGFHNSISGILDELYGGTFKAQDLPAPTATTIMAKDLKMPTTWKSSLAVEGRLPGGIKATLEGIYNKDITAVYVHKLGQAEVEGGVQLPGEPQARPSWKSEGLKNSQNSNVTPYYITNTDAKGHYYSVTAMLQKDFLFGLSAMAAYTRSGSKSAAEGIGDQVSSAYNTMTYSSMGSNVAELGHSAYVSPNRLIANISYRIDEGQFGATTLGLFYEGYNHCYVGSYSYTRYSYTMNNVTGDGGANNLIYIPTTDDLAKMTFKDEANKTAFNEFIEADKYLSKHRGEYSQRGGVVAPWQHRFNFKVAQDFDFRVAGRKNTIQVALDVNNIGNLLNSNWGAYDQLSSDKILNYDSKTSSYTFTEPTWGKLTTLASTWEMLLSLRWFF